MFVAPESAIAVEGGDSELDNVITLHFSFTPSPARQAPINSLTSRRQQCRRTGSLLHLMGVLCIGSHREAV